jgi:glycosyltransferase involved in cell wall biosynthesis
MRITHVINSLQTGGAETLVAGIGMRQARRGHQVRFLSIKNLVQVAVDPAIEVITLDYKKYDPRAWTTIARLTREDDIVHAHLAPAHYFAMAATLNKLVITEHSSHNRRWSMPPFRWLDRWLYNHCGRAVSISEGVRDRLLELGVRPWQMSVIHNGIDSGRVLQLAEQPLSIALPASAEGRPLIGMVSRFTPAKNYEAVLTLAAQLPEAFFVLVGEGETRGEIEQRAKGLRLENVMFAGRMTNPVPLIARLKVGLQLSHWEGFGIAALEMMALGLPVLLTDVPGLNELNSRQPQMPFYNDEKQAAGELRRLLNDKVYYAEQSARALEVASEYELERTVERYLALYKELRQS